MRCLRVRRFRLKCWSGDWVHTSLSARVRVCHAVLAENTCAPAQTSISQLNSSLGSLDTFLLTGTLNVTSLAASDRLCGRRGGAAAADERQHALRARLR